MIPDLIICIDKNAQARPRIVKYLECYNWDFSARVVHPLKLIHKLLLGWFYKSTLIRYTIWPVIVLFYVYRNREKKFIAIGLETALPMAVLKVNFIFDNADNIYLSKNWPRLVALFLKKVESYVVKSSYRTIVPDNSRRIMKSNNYVVIPNIPTLKSLKCALDINQEDFPGKTVLYVNGWLTETRGIRVLGSALARMKRTDLVVLVAGSFDNKELKELFESIDCVIYLGNLSLCQALSYYRISDYCFTAYDPAIPINRKAAPNKWGDCKAFSVVPLINNEVETISTMFESKEFIGFHYNDEDELLEKLESLSNQKILQKTFKVWDDYIDLLL